MANKFFMASKNSKGMSLLELLFSLVVLAVGIYGAMKLFPQGLYLIENARNRSMASKLAEKEIEHWKNHHDNLPEAIVAAHPDTIGSGYILDYQYSYDYSAKGGDTIIEPLTPDALDIKVKQTPEVYSYKNPSLTMIRHIVGETLKVPGPAVDIDGDGNLDRVYNLAFGQPEDEDLINPGFQLYALRLYYPTPYNIVDASDLKNNNNDYGHYAITNSQLSFDKVNYPRWFRVDYSCLIIGPPQDIIEIISEEVFVPAGQSNAQNTLAYKPIPSSLEVYRALGQRYRWGDPGYVLDPNIPLYKIYDNVVINPVAAILAFTGDPGILAQDEDDSDGDGDVDEIFVQPSQDRVARVKLDYRVTNWETLKETNTIPDDGVIKLALTNLDKEPDLDPIRPGIQNLLTVDIETSQDLTPLGIDYKRGRIQFDPILAGRAIKIFYRTMENWALQLQKTRTQYFAYTVNPDPVDPTRLQLTFKPTEVNKIAVVDYVFCNTGVPELINGEQQQVGLDFPYAFTLRNPYVTILIDRPIFVPVPGVPQIRVTLKAVVKGNVIEKQDEIAPTPPEPPLQSSAKNFIYLTETGIIYATLGPPRFPWHLFLGTVTTDETSIVNWATSANRLTVRGVSLKARVVWQIKGGRTDHIDVDTYLTEKG